MEIAPGIHYLPIPLGPIWTGVTLVADDRLLIVDTAMRGDGLRHILPYIREHGLGMRSPLLINTHMHCDHIGSNAELRQALGAEVAAHEADAPGVQELDYQVEHLYGRFAPWLGQPVPDFRNWLHQVAGPAVPVDLRLHDGEEVDVGRHRFRVMHTPGHSHGTVALYEPAQRLLLGGDAVQVAGTLDTGVPMLVDIAGYRQSLQRLLALDADLLVVSHPFKPFADAVLRGPAIREFILEAQAAEGRFARRARQALQEAGGAVTLAGVAEAVADEGGVAVNLFAAMTAQAYLDLFAKGEA